MAELHQSFDMLEMMDRPGFFVSNGKIIFANSFAKKRMVELTSNIQDLLITGKQEYEEFTDGCLYLTLQVAGTVYEASVTNVGGLHLFLMDAGPSRSELQALALAATQLRRPLSKIVIAVEQVETTGPLPFQQIQQGLFQLQRMIGNMSDAAQLQDRSINMSTQDICSVFDEILEKASALLADSGVTLQYTLPDRSIYMRTDKALLERAIYNLLSNAAKFAPQNTIIEAKVIRKGHMLHFMVSGPNASANELPSNLFTRYLREPGLEDSRNGIGLGMVFVHGAAFAHNGTVLIEKRESNTIRITMTMEIRKSAEATVRSRVLMSDLYGGRDQALVELSDVLPSSLYSETV